MGRLRMLIILLKAALGALATKVYYKLQSRAQILRHKVEIKIENQFSPPLSRDDTSILINYGVPRAPKALRRMPFLNWQKPSIWHGQLLCLLNYGLLYS